MPRASLLQCGLPDHFARLQWSSSMRHRNHAAAMGIWRPQQHAFVGVPIANNMQISKFVLYDSDPRSFTVYVCIVTIHVGVPLSRNRSASVSVLQSWFGCVARMVWVLIHDARPTTSIPGGCRPGRRHHLLSVSPICLSPLEGTDPLCFWGSEGKWCNIVEYHAISISSILGFVPWQWRLMIGCIESIGSVAVEENFSILNGLVPRFLVECIRYNIHQYNIIW